MASVKAENSPRRSNQESFKRESIEFGSENKDLRLGMERRKFSYTIHIPERRSCQDRDKPA